MDPQLDPPLVVSWSETKYYVSYAYVIDQSDQREPHTHRRTLFLLYIHFSFYIFIITRKAVTVTLTEREIFILSFSLYYIITRVAPHCVNTLRILHAAYDATKDMSAS